MMETQREKAGGLPEKDVESSKDSSSYEDAEGLSFGDIWEDDISSGSETPPTAASRGSIFFKPIVQRQKWGQGYILPHVNWGDLFFDLFYVGVAYNLSDILKGGITGGDNAAVALLYFFGCFGTVYTCFWQGKMLFDARFEVPNDVVHWTMEIMFLCWLALATQHIQPVSVMSINGPGENQEMFYFCLGNLLGSFMYMLLCFEIGFIWVKGQEDVARFNGRTNLLTDSLSFAFTLSATIYSGWKHFGGNSSGGPDHVAMWILLVGWLVRPLLYMFSLFWRGLYLKSADPKKMTVPMNIDFVIHRYGEWMMLMLGESILSLVIVDKAVDNNYMKHRSVFIRGVISVILLQVLYFTSQPQSKEGHAFRRSRAAGIFFSFVNQFYSAALIIVGVSWKLMLIEYTEKYSKNDGYDDKIRFLGEDSGYTTLERQSRIAKLFCYGLSAAYVTLDILNLTHTGISASVDKYRFKDKNRFSVIGLAIVVFLRYCTAAAVLAGGYYLEIANFKPPYIAAVGIVSVSLQVVLRYLGKTFFNEKDASHSPASNHDSHGSAPDAIGAENKSKGLRAWGMNFVLPPKQRQKWGDDYCLPHVDWGDLFFDLFYVGAAYNLGKNIKYDIQDDPLMALIYFFGVFGAIFTSFWSTKMLFDARFVLGNDLFHRTLEITHLVCLAFATLYIRPKKYMSNCGDYREMFQFCLFNVLGSLIYLFYNAEIGFGWVDGQKAAGFNARTEVMHQSLCLILKVAAAVYSGLQYYGDEEGKPDNVPIYLLLAGWLCVQPIMLLTHWSRGLWKKNVDFKSFTVPMNIHFVIHRIGEWTMLMLGESVLSLVIVDDIAKGNDRKYYLVFFWGVLGAIFLQILYFKSQPLDVSHHAMRRSRLGGIAFNFLVQFYSAALILVGVSYKMMLTEFKSVDHHRAIRFLAAGEESDGYDNHDEHWSTISKLFCYSLAATFVTLDLINLSHSGVAAAVHRCFSETKMMAVRAIVVVVLSRYVIVVGIVVISYFIPEGYSHYVALLGLVAVVLQVGIRLVQTIYFHSKAKRFSIEEREAVGIQSMGIDLFRNSVRAFRNSVD